MKHVLLTLISLATLASAAPLVFEGTEGPGKGKHIVFMADDHEYRSEESLPQLARILAKNQGFKCTVLFGIDPESGEIVGGDKSNMPGMEALDTADLAVVFLRFQNFPPEQMKHFDDYIKRGGPVVGMRTATHGFKMPKGAPFEKYSFDYKGSDYELGFGHQVLGQTWVGHYGTNHKQSTRIAIVDDNPDVRRLIRRILQSQGNYSLFEATNGREAVELARKEQPNLMILDLMMPEMDGFAVMDALKADVTTADIPIVVVTAKELTPSEKEHLRGHVQTLMQKGDFLSDDLLDEVRALLG